jgi:hypothetical protein
MKAITKLTQSKIIELPVGWTNDDIPNFNNRLQMITKNISNMLSNENIKVDRIIFDIRVDTSLPERPKERLDDDFWLSVALGKSTKKNTI